MARWRDLGRLESRGDPPPGAPLSCDFLLTAFDLGLPEPVVSTEALIEVEPNLIARAVRIRVGGRSHVPTVGRIGHNEFPVESKSRLRNLDSLA